MITFEEAEEIIRSQPVRTETHTIGFQESVGYTLAKPVVSDIAMPPFDKAAMDGYACRRVDLPGPLKVMEEIPAGRVGIRRIERGTCASIMTGAPLPDGADCVIMMEYTELNSQGEVLFLRENTKANICYQGEDVQEGQVLIDAGTLLRPEHVAIMAATGTTIVTVSVMPTIGVLSTGDELVEPGLKPVSGQIRNTNGYQIIAQLTACGFPAFYEGIVADTAAATQQALQASLEKFDVVILTGGVSQGNYDYVPQVMEGCGVEVLFHHLAVQPGKPSLFGRACNGSYVFGLPGNPVSSFLQTELLVKLLCYRIQGCDFAPLTVRMTMGKTYLRKRVERKAFIPVRLAEGKVWPVEYHGSAHIQALAQTDGFISLEPGFHQITEGDQADVRLI